MLLTVDIGNSSISLGLFRSYPSQIEARPEIILRAKLSSDTKRSSDEYAVIIRALISSEGFSVGDITAAVLSSVVPQLTYTINLALQRLDTPAVPIPVLTVGSGVRTGISLKVDDPGQLGADIVTNASAAVKLYGAPVITVDLGTATVIGAVREDKVLLGVSIAPGPVASLEGLQAAAALIPYTELKAPESTLGKNTTAALRAGLVTGTACMVDGMIDRIVAEYHLPADTPMVITGGLSELVRPLCRHPLIHEPDLTLLGLSFIHSATIKRETKKKT